MIEKKTAGQQVYEELLNPTDYGDSSNLEYSNIKLQQEGYEERFINELNLAKKFKDPFRDFYMEVHFLAPGLLHGKKPVFPCIPRYTLPRPTFSQAVYLYHRKSGEVELIWSIPPLTECIKIDMNGSDIHPDEKELYGYVMDFKKGLTFNKAKRINRDLEDAGQEWSNLIQ